MRRIIASIVAFMMIILMLALPCAAAENIAVYVGFDYETKMLTFSGSAPGNSWITYYLLYPEKTPSDILSHSVDNPIVENFGQLKVGTSGTFSHEFKVSGEEGIYTLYITSGNSSIEEAVDTSDNVSINGVFTPLYDLGAEYEAPTKATVKDIFHERKGKLPTEMPVIEPVESNNLNTIYVDANKGDDSTADGSINNAYKTIAAALSAHSPKAGMVLCLREGNYSMTDSVSAINGVQGTIQRPFVIKSYEGEEVVISGGTNIDGSLFTSITDSDILSRLDPSVTDDVVVADLKDLGISNYGEIKYSDVSVNAPVLYVGGIEYTIARWPNAGTTGMIMAPYEISDTNGGTANKMNVPGVGYVSTNGVIDSGRIAGGVGSSCGNGRTYSKRATENPDKWEYDTGIEICVEDLRPFSWVNTGDIWVFGKFYADWAIHNLQVSEFNADTRSVRTNMGLTYGARYGENNTFYYYNVLEELDAPGEWFLDKKAEKLYVYPSTNITNKSVVFAPSDSTMLKISNSSNVVIDGIKFANARGTALAMSGTNNIIQNCTFENVGMGVNISGTYSGVINSDFKNINDCAIKLVGDSGAENYSSMTPDRLFAQNNKTYNTRGAIDNTGIGNIISHNFISNSIGSAIYLRTGRENIVEYNEIVGGPRQIDDSGAIYVNGNNAFHRGEHVRYNYIHDIKSTYNGEEITPFAIYFDDMLSECYAYGNIIDGSSMNINNGSEIAVYNNVFLNDSNTIVNQAYYYDAARNSSDGWHSRWIAALSKNSISKGLTVYDSENKLTGPVFDRYPHLQNWAKLMLQRINEYNTTGKATTSSINSEYYTKNWLGIKTYYNLNQYLSASRDLYIGNNVFVNSKAPTLSQTTATNKAGIIRTVYENNYQSTTNPFAGTTYGDETVANNLGIDQIPFDKMSITSEVSPFVNAKAQAIRPANTTIATVSKDDLLLQWTAVEGAQLYKVELANDINFTSTSTLASAELRDLSYAVTRPLQDDTIYYWRVTTTPQGKGSTGGAIVSDTFEFKTSSASTSSTQHNTFGVTDYRLYDTNETEIDAIPETGNFEIKAYAYNLTNAEKSAMVYAACYDEDNKFICLEKAIVTAEPDSFSEEITLKMSAPNTTLVKLFVWSQDGEMIPYTFVKTIK